MFESEASNLVAQDANSATDIFLHDRALSTTTRISVSSAGAEANAQSTRAVVGGSGRFVVFESDASNLVAGDSNGASDVFLHDRVSGTTICVSRALGGSTGNSISVGGSISHGGDYVVFASVASDLIVGDSNGATDVYLYDVLGASLEAVSVTSGGVTGNDSSLTPSEPACVVAADGRYVAFSSYASDLVAGDTNGLPDVFVRDRVAISTARVNVGPGGVAANDYSFAASMSDDGRVIGFFSSATNLDPVNPNSGNAYVHDRQTATTRVVGMSPSGVPAESGFEAFVDSTGDFAGFWSTDASLVQGDTNSWEDCFLFDLRTGLTTRVNLGAGGQQANGFSLFAVGPSKRGRCVVFSSSATNLVSGDSNGKLDVFVRDTGGLAPYVYCTAKTNSLGCVPSIASSGTPCSSSGSSFVVSAVQVQNNKAGLLFYGVSGRQAAAFFGGSLCMKGPWRRTPLQNSLGNPPPDDCSGSYSVDFNAQVASGLDPSLVAGQTVWAQYYMRDPGFAAPNNIGLSNAIEFDIGPY